MAFLPLRIFAAFSATLLFLAASCAAQNPRTSPTRLVSGVVKDALGRAVAGSNVTLRSMDGRSVRTATTDTRGAFRFKEPGAGFYSITAQSVGFKPATVPVLLSQNSRARVEIMLESKQALSLPVTASRIRTQNTLSSTETNKYTLTDHDISNLAQGQATPLNQVVLQMPGVGLDQNQEIHIRGEQMASTR
jgi:hypothetical protein